MYDSGGFAQKSQSGAHRTARRNAANSKFSILSFIVRIFHPVRPATAVAKSSIFVSVRARFLHSDQIKEKRPPPIGNNAKVSFFPNHCAAVLSSMGAVKVALMASCSKGWIAAPIPAHWAIRDLAPSAAASRPVEKHRPSSNINLAPFEVAYNGQPEKKHLARRMIVLGVCTKRVSTPFRKLCDKVWEIFLIPVLCCVCRQKAKNAAPDSIQIPPPVV